MPLLANALGEEWTREIFGNIPAGAKLAFYLLSAAALACFTYGIYRRARLWRLGRPEDGSLARPREMILRFVREVVGQRRVRGRGLASVAHAMMFWGFLVLFMGTLLIAVEHLLAGLLGRSPDRPLFHKGVYYAVYEVTLDGFGLVFLAGVALLAWRRARRPESLDHRAADWGVLAMLFLIGVTGYVTESLRILSTPGTGDSFSFTGNMLAMVGDAAGISSGAAAGAHLATWWIHAVAALLLIALFPYTRLLHSLAGAINLSLPRQTLGTLPLTTIEELEETGRVGVGALNHFTRRQLLQLDACVSCGRCEDACPAFEAGKPLSPRDVVQDIRRHLNVVGPTLIRGNDSPDNASDRQLTQSSAALHGETVSAETLYSCTTCAACVDVCPLGVDPLSLITDMRQFHVADGQLRGAAATSLQKTQRSGNPWGMPIQDRFAWADGLDVPTVDENPGFEILYWVGCAAAYDRRVQKVARSVVRLLKRANVNFAVLGSAERCTGESARRVGDEFVFQELAAGNLETLARHNVRRIVTHCPHCLNSFRNDYPQLGGQFEVLHHTELLAQLVEAGRLPRGKSSVSMTYHDPCYLARVHDIVDPPRLLLGGLSVVEMPRHARHTSCCGAGGGRMWMDDAPQERIGQSRVTEVLDTGASTLAVSCPFCLIMMGDGIAAQNAPVEVRDIAEILADALGEDA